MSTPCNLLDLEGPATIEVLPAVAEAIADRMPVLLDGGVRRRVDVLKAIALGASAVLVGRPILWALAVDGQRGVELALRLLRQEFDLAMAVAGCPEVKSITTDLLVPRRFTPTQ
jgi:4-hydroxymandelate oxidase